MSIEKKSMCIDKSIVEDQYLKKQKVKEAIENLCFHSKEESYKKRIVKSVGVRMKYCECCYKGVKVSQTHGVPLDDDLDIDDEF